MANIGCARGLHSLSAFLVLFWLRPTWKPKGEGGGGVVVRERREKQSSVNI